MNATTEQYYIYIISGLSKRLYVGVTNDLYRRVYEHKNHLIEGFTKKYNLTRLVYFEAGEHPNDAIRREKQVKGWLRSKKVELIESLNLEWDDLAEFWFKDQQKPAVARQTGS